MAWKPFAIALPIVRNSCTLTQVATPGEQLANMVWGILADVKKKILDFGGIEILVGNTLCKKEVMKEKSLVLAAECLSNCAENG